MWKDLVVEVFVTLPGGDGNAGKIATGYPVAPNRILTARHAVVPEDAVTGANPTIEVRWHHPTVTTGWQPVKGIVWQQERWDLALLDCVLPPEVSPWGCFLSEQRPQDNMEWAGVGFPRVAGKKDGVRQAFHMGGKVRSMLADEDRFDLVEIAGPTTEAEWKGASGSPVVVNGRILGVVAEVPAGLGARRLHAVPLWKVLREDADFCREVGYRKRQERREQMRRRIEQALQSAGAAVDALAAEFPDMVTDDGAWQMKGQKEKVSLLVDQLLNFEVGRLIRACQRAFQKLGGGASADPIGSAVQIILPAIYDHGEVETVRGACNDTQAALIALPAYYPTVAEIVMAGVDGRETLFCPRESDEDFPKGRLCLPEPPECGFDDDGMKTVEALNQHLKGKFSWQSSQDLSMIVDAFMVKRFAGPDTGGYSPEQRVELAAMEIEYQARERNRTHYLIVAEPEDPGDRAALEGVLHTIRARYPGLMCLSLSKSFESRKADLGNFRPLLELLPKKQRNPE